MFLPRKFVLRCYYALYNPRLLSEVPEWRRKTASELAQLRFRDALSRRSNVDNFSVYILLQYEDRQRCYTPPSLPIYPVGI